MELVHKITLCGVSPSDFNSHNILLSTPAKFEVETPDGRIEREVFDLAAIDFSECDHLENPTEIGHKCELGKHWDCWCTEAMMCGYVPLAD
jgi:hypothetical protein